MIVAIKNAANKMLPRCIYIAMYRVYSLVRNASRYVTSLKYAGDQYECPFCKGRFSKFLPAGKNFPVIEEKQVIGGGYRMNAMCPRCYCSDRERLLFLFLEEKKKKVFSENIKLLHVAPERNLSRKLKSHANIDYVSADLISPLADVQMDITNIQQQDDLYDVIICNHVLEHIPDDARAMRELFRVLKPGGFAILQVPISFSIDVTFEDFSITSPEERALMFGQMDHVRIYGPDYTLRLEDAGFSVETHDFSRNLEPRDALKHGLLKDEKIFDCSKPQRVTTGNK